MEFKSWVSELESLQKRNDRVELTLAVADTPLLTVKVIVVKDGTEFYSIHFPDGRMLCNLSYIDLVHKLVVIAAHGPAA